MSAPIYRNYRIQAGPHYDMHSRWEFVHEDFDGIDDPRYGTGATPDDCRQQIDEIEELLAQGRETRRRTGDAL
jgi:hypothetical protein